jgi:hypothetical protein
MGPPPTNREPGGYGPHCFNCMYRTEPIHVQGFNLNSAPGISSLKCVTCCQERQAHSLDGPSAFQARTCSKSTRTRLLQQLLSRVHGSDRIRDIAIPRLQRFLSSLWKLQRFQRLRWRQLLRVNAAAPGQQRRVNVFAPSSLGAHSSFRVRITQPEASSLQRDRTLTMLLLLQYGGLDQTASRGETPPSALVCTL